MITMGLMIYIGILVGAPSWFFWVCGIMAVVKMVSGGVELYKKGREKGE